MRWTGYHFGRRGSQVLGRARPGAGPGRRAAKIQIGVALMKSFVFLGTAKNFRITRAQLRRGRHHSCAQALQQRLAHVAIEGLGPDMTDAGRLDQPGGRQYAALAAERTPRARSMTVGTRGNRRSTKAKLRTTKTRSRNRDSSVAMSSMKRSAKGSRCGSPPRSVKDSIIAEPRSGNAGGPAGGTIERGPRPRADGQDIRASGRLPGAARQEEIRGARVAHHARNFAICRNSMARHRDIPPACHGNICGSAFCGGASRAPGRTAPARRAGRKGHPRSPIRGAPGARDTPPAARPPGRAIVGPAAPMAAFHLNRRTRGNTARNSPRSGRDTA